MKKQLARRPQVVLVGLLAMVTVIGCGTEPRLAGSGATTSQRIGSTGGTIELEGAKLTIPPGALAGDQEIRITSMQEPASDDFGPLTPVYQFEPAGLVFAAPAEIRFELSDEAPVDAVIFWSEYNGEGFEQLDATVASDQLSAQIHHFSRGFGGHRRTDGGTSSRDGGDANVGDAGHHEHRTDGGGTNSNGTRDGGTNSNGTRDGGTTSSGTHDGGSNSNDTRDGGTVFSGTHDGGSNSNDTRDAGTVFNGTHDGGSNSNDTRDGGTVFNGTHDGGPPSNTNHDGGTASNGTHDAGTVFNGTHDGGTASNGTRDAGSAP